MDNVNMNNSNGLSGRKSSSINSTGNNQSLLGEGRTTSQSKSVTRPRSESHGITDSGSNNENSDILHGKEKSQSPAARAVVSAKQNSAPKTSKTGQRQHQNSNTTNSTSPTNIVISDSLNNTVSVKTFNRALSQHLANRTSMVKSTVGFDRSRNLRAQVEKAMREHKIYSCVGVYPAVRKALQKRGWIEKNPSLGIAKSTNLANTSKELESRGFEDESDGAWMNRVLRDYPADFIWVIRRDNIDWRGLHKDQIINRYPKAFFTTKVGIAACLQNIHWFSETGISDTFFPRCYRLCIEEEKSAFVDDFRLSACMGLLKWVVSAFEKDGEAGVMDSSSRVVSLAVDFAIRQINNYVRMRRHEDIDWLMPPAFMGQHWDVFLNQYYNVVLLKGKLAPNDSQDTGKMKYEASKRALSRLAPYWPQLNIDGTCNIWICKPGARSRGKGIIIMNQVEKILDLLSQSNCREANWVVQKYIERPLLIYKTKFDIRQWFVVSDWAPLTVWFYKESYIRFCTKPFSMEDFHESIHLCNNAVQCRYQNSDKRDTALPDENMWDCYTFQAYLKTQGKMDYWDSLIYPGMKQGILGVLLASQDTVDVRKNCFELYGADFMLSEDLTPWLIEINSCPCMAPSTSVTARMCAQCLEDTVKVIVDRREDRNADTGMFELIYKQQNLSAMPLQPFNGVELIIQGKKLSRDVDWPSIMTKYNSKRASNSGTTSSAKLKSSHHPPSILSNGLTFMDLVQRLRLKDGSSGSSESINSSSNNNSMSNSITQKAASNKHSSSSGASESTEEKQKNAVNKRKQNTEGSGSKMMDSNSLMHGLDNVGGGLTNQSANIFKRNQSVNPSSTITTQQEQQQQLQPVNRSSLATVPLKSPTNSTLNGQQRVRLTEQHYVSATETSLSTLLKSSSNKQPTMADLIRITQEVGAESLNRAKNYGHTNNSKENDENSPSVTNNSVESRPRSHTQNQNQIKSSAKTVTSSTTSASTPRGGVSHSVTSGKIKPNARTHSNLTSSSSSTSPRTSNKVHVINHQNSKDSKGKEQYNKYGKLQSMQSSFYDIHKINNTTTTSSSSNSNSSNNSSSDSQKVEEKKFIQKKDSSEVSSSSSSDLGIGTGDGSFSLSLRDSTSNSISDSTNVITWTSSNNSSLESNHNDVVIYLDEKNVNFSPTTGPESNIDCKSQSQARIEHCRSTHDRLTSTQSETLSPSKSPVVVSTNIITSTPSISPPSQLTKSSTTTTTTSDSIQSISHPSQHLKYKQKTIFANPPPPSDLNCSIKKNLVHLIHQSSKFEVCRQFQKRLNSNASSSTKTKSTQNPCSIPLKRETNFKMSLAEDENEEGLSNNNNVRECLTQHQHCTNALNVRPEAEIQNDLNTSDMLRVHASAPTTTTEQTTTKHSLTQIPQHDNGESDDSQHSSSSKSPLFTGKDPNNNIDHTFMSAQSKNYDTISMSNSNYGTNETAIMSKDHFMIDEKPKLLNPYFPLNLTSHDSIDDDDNNNNSMSSSDNHDLDGVNLNCPTLLTPPIFHRCKLPRTTRNNKSSRHGTCKNLSSHNNARRLHQHHPHTCYKMSLEHPLNRAALFSSRKYLATLPLKTVNLNLT